MTYTELVTFVADICENTFPTVDMDMFIKQAEQKIYNTVQIANLRKNVTGLTTANNKYLSAPNDFLSVYSIAIYPLSGPNANEYTYLLNKDVNFIREAYPKATDTGQPAHYAIFGPNSALPDELTFILGPTPDAQYGTELHYYYYPESNGTLIEAIRYMKGEADMIALYQSMYDRAMIQLKQLGDGKQRQDAYRDGQARVQVV